MLTTRESCHRLREGRRVPHTLGDAPTWQFGARLKGAWGTSTSSSPGPVYKAETALGLRTAPVYKMAPRFCFGHATRRKRGLLQSRDEALKVQSLLTFPMYNISFFHSFLKSGYLFGLNVSAVGRPFSDTALLN